MDIYNTRCRDDICSWQEWVRSIFCWILFINIQFSQEFLYCWEQEAKRETTSSSLPLQPTKLKRIWKYSRKRVGGGSDPLKNSCTLDCRAGGLFKAKMNSFLSQAWDGKNGVKRSLKGVFRQWNCTIFMTTIRVTSRINCWNSLRVTLLRAFQYISSRIYWLWC